MSFTLATVADALIEFILSLLRDPEVRAEFEQDPDAALAHRGLSHVSASDVQAVAPVIIERTHVVQVPVYIRQAQQEQHHASPVVREIQQVSNHFAWIDDRDTIVDQSVNQNIWADGDVTQTFDNHAVVASGDDAIAAGDGLEVDKTTDQSTNIDAGGDVNIGNDTDATLVEDSYGHQTDDSTTTDDSTQVQIDGSANDGSSDVQASDSGNQHTDATTTTGTAVDVTAVGDSTDVQVGAPATDVQVDGSAADATAGATTATDGATADAPAPDAQADIPAADAPLDTTATDAAADAPVEDATATEPDPSFTDSAAQYAEMDSDADMSQPFDGTDSVLTEDTADDQF